MSRKVKPEDRNGMSSNRFKKQRHNNHVKARIDKTKQNNTCRLCGRDESINHISECSELAQRGYNTRHDWIGKVTKWELCKTFKFKWYVHNPGSV